MTEIQDRLAAIKNSLAKKLDGDVDVGLILGSGLGGLAETLGDATSIAYGEIDGLPEATAPGHAGRLHIGESNGRRVAICAGRFHLYEGHQPLDAAMTAYLLYALGAKTMVVTNAAGALTADFTPGDVMLIDDHINFSGIDSTKGPESPDVGPRFTDMSRAYCPTLRDATASAAAELNIDLKRGIYGAVTGPCFETSAERRAYRLLGADAIGMSTVFEVMAANHCGMRALGFSAITNMATGDADQQPEVMDDVFHYAKVAGEKIERLYHSLVPKL